MPNGSLVPARFLILLIAVVVLFCFWPLHFFTLTKKPYGCYNGRHWSMRDPLVVFPFVTINTPHYDCPEKDRYDPKTVTPLNKVSPDSLPDVYN